MKGKNKGKEPWNKGLTKKDYIKRHGDNCKHN